MKPLLQLLVLLLLILAGCSGPEDTQPLPDPVRSYYILNNFFTEDYDVAWEINGTLVQSDHPYGVPIAGNTTLNSSGQSITFSVRKSGSGSAIQSDAFAMNENRFYNVAILGNENDPYILFEPMNLEPPSEGMVRVRFMQAVRELDPIDVYIGGNTPESLRVSGITYTDISPYVEVTGEQAWQSLYVTPYQTFPSDSTIFSFTENEAFQTDRIYLGVIARINTDPSSSVQMLLYDQPMEPVK